MCEGEGSRLLSKAVWKLEVSLPSSSSCPWLLPSMTQLLSSSAREIAEDMFAKDLGTLEEEEEEEEDEEEEDEEDEEDEEEEEEEEEEDEEEEEEEVEEEEG